MKRPAIALAIVTLVIISGIVAGVAIAQGGLSGVFTPRPSDPDTVATVNGELILRGAIRRTVDFALLQDPTADVSRLTRDALRAFIRTRAALTEARRRGINPTAQAAADLQAAQQDCRQEVAGKPCREFIDALGLTWDAFWEQQLPKYENAVLVQELVTQVSKERKVDVSSYEKWSAFEQAYLVEIASKADIKWFDKDMSKLYTSG